MIIYHYIYICLYVSLYIFLHNTTISSPKAWIYRVDDLFSAKSPRLSQFFMGKPTINGIYMYLLVPLSIGKL